MHVCVPAPRVALGFSVVVRDAYRAHATCTTCHSMNHACQSAVTLNELLREAAGFVRMGPPDERLATKLERLQHELVTSSVVSAEVEQEIVSLREIARFRIARPARTGS